MPLSNGRTGIDMPAPHVASGASEVLLHYGAGQSNVVGVVVIMRVK